MQMTPTTPLILWDEPELAPAGWDTELKQRGNIAPLPRLEASELRAQVARAQADIFLLMQPTLQRVGLPCLDAWRAELPDMGVVLVGRRSSEDEAFLRTAVAHGADDFVFSTDSAWTVGHRVESVVQLRHARSASGLRQVAELAQAEPPIRTTPLAQLHDPGNGRVSAKLVAEHLGVPLKDLARGLGRPYAGVHKNPAGAGLQKSLHPVMRTLELLRVLLPKEADTRVWLHTPHADLDGLTPLAVILQGKGEVIADMLEAAINGYPS